MNNILIRGILCIFVSSVISCTKSNDNIIQFNISNAINNPTEYNYIDYMEEIDIYRLDDSIPIGQINKFAIFSDTICIITNNDKIVNYNLFSGNYMNEIGRKGRAINEYLSSYQAFFVGRNVIVDGSSSNNLNIYTLNGDYTKSISIKTTNLLGNYISDRISCGDNHFLGYHFNKTGTDSLFVLKISTDGEIVKKYNRTTNIKKHKPIDVGGFGQLYKYKNYNLVWEQCNDSIYRIENNTLKPYIILKRNKNHIYNPLKKDNKRDVLLGNFHETNKFLFIDVYSRQDNNGILICNKNNASVSFYLYKEMNIIDRSIFINNLCDQYDNKYMYSYIDAFEYITANNKGLLDKYNIIKNISINENSNPLILRVKYKK